MSEVVVQTEHLLRRVESGDTMATIVNGIDLTVYEGEFLAITGPSGSGKSSLLYLIGLLDAPTAGDVHICGQATSAMSESERADMRLAKLGFVFQFHFLLPEFTALENVMLPMRTLGKLSMAEMREKGTKLLTALGLGDQVNRKPGQLSGGQRQRVAIARALSNDPAIIIADEPTGALDTIATDQVFKILRDVANSGRTVIVVTHDVKLAAKADRRVNVVDGKISEIVVNEAAKAPAPATN
ncbi:MAG: ABC transporter ATP-binding protein [Bradyrhizobium sp.]|nr:ABC transporter ATP-binding protein [Bradyrhizobium sp.]